MAFPNLFFLVLLLYLAVANCLEYSQLLRLNASCSPRDTCSRPRDSDHPELHNCDCASACAAHGTCCIDSPFRTDDGRTPSCRSSGHLSESHVFMVDTCPASYKGRPSVRRRCETTDKGWIDPLTNVPVTDSASNVTYKSLSCALCHGRDPDRLVPWHVAVDCTSLRSSMHACAENRDFTLSNMVYVREKVSWGLWSYDPETDWQFRRLALDYQMPEQVRQSVVLCRPDLVSECRPEWRDHAVRQLCRSYMGAVYAGSVGYRNVHCAICNGHRDLSVLSCRSGASYSFRGPSLNFGILVDFNWKDGEKVGSRCGGNKVYDPFAKKCRTIECPQPGYVLRNMKCVQE